MPQIQIDDIDLAPEPEEALWAMRVLSLPFSVPLDEGLERRSEDDVEARIIDEENRLEKRVAVRGFLHTLTRRQRFVIRCLFWREVSRADVARVLGVSRAAITQMLDRIFKQGRAYFQSHVPGM